MKTLIKVFLSLCLTALSHVGAFAQPADYVDYFSFNGTQSSALDVDKTASGTNIPFTTDKDGNANSACAFMTESEMGIWGINQSSIGWTISFLIKVTDADGYCILHSSASGSYSSMLVYENEKLAWYGNSSMAAEFNTPVILNKWYNVVIANSGGNTANFYINGSIFGTGNGIGLNYLVGNPINFGKNGSIPSFVGVLDEVRFYNRPLTTTEIAQYPDPDPNSSSISAWIKGGDMYHPLIYLNDANALVGIGMMPNTSDYKLQVAGNVKATKFFGDGSGLTGINSSQWTTGGSNIYFNKSNSNVLIGKTSQTNSSYKLDVEGKIYSTTYNGEGINLISPSGPQLIFGHQNGVYPDAIIWANASYKGLQFMISSGGNLWEAMRLSGDGNLLLGKTTQTNNTYKLDVTGDINATSFIGDGSKLTGIATSQWTTSGSNIYFNTTNGNVLIGKTTQTDNTYKLDVGGTVSATKFIGDGSGLTGVVSSQWSTSGSNIYFNTSNGNVLIGKISQINTNYKLDVSGSLNVDGNIYSKDLVIMDNNQRVASLSYYAPQSLFSIGSGINYLDRLYFKSITTEAGKTFIGIGTMDPQEKLEVVGNVRATKFIGDGSQLTGIIASQWTTNSSGISYNGIVGIGTSNPDPNSKLSVKGNIHAEEVTVDLAVPADFVFEPTYKMMPLAEVEKFVKANKHLPEIPSGKEIQQKGLNIGAMQNKLLQKIEELTLYSIAQEKANAELKEKLAQQEKEIKELKELMMKKLK